MADKKDQKRTFRQYVMDAQRSYTYQIKFLDECTETMLEELETVLAKFDLESMSAVPKHVKWHTNPADFSAPNGEVFVVEVVTGMPLNQQLKTTIAQNCGVPDSYVAMISENDPATEVETMISKFGRGEAKLLDSEYSEQDPVEHDDYYGEGFKNRIMREMEDIVRERSTHVSQYMDPEADA